MRLIDADAFIKENHEIIDCEIDHPKYQDTIRELIDEAPTVELNRQTGEWITNGWVWKCRDCGGTLAVKTPYCPHCGAYMGGEQNEQKHI